MGAQNKENNELDKLYSSIQIATNGSSQITVSIEELNTFIETKVNEKIEKVLESSYQKLRSDNYEEVPFVNDTKYVAPCDGYYCYYVNNNNVTNMYVDYIWHYNKYGVLIASSTSPSYAYGVAGAEIYMKKGEWIELKKQSKVEPNSSKFFYAVGCKPENIEE